MPAPVHPEVTSDQPGHCPKCGMKLLVTVFITGHGHRNRHYPVEFAQPGNRGEAHRPGHDPACRLAGVSQE